MTGAVQDLIRVAGILRILCVVLLSCQAPITPAAGQSSDSLQTTSASPAETRSARRVSDELAERGFRPYRKKHALVIGIDHYGPGIPGLNYAVRDARSIRDLLLNHLGFDKVLLLENERAQRSDILRAIVELNHELQNDDQLFFYFAGHGVSFREAEQEIGYILPQDTSGFDEPSVAVDAISMTDLRERVTKLQAKHILLALDACFGGYAARSPRGMAVDTANYLRVITTSRARQIITAGRRGEVVYEGGEWGHSAFAFKLLEGLRERLADSNHDGIVITPELFAYLSASVNRITRGAQTPQYAELSPDQGEFVFILPSVKEPLPPPPPVREMPSRPPLPATSKITWTVVTRAMPTPRANPNAVISGSEILVLGGHGGTHVYSMSQGMRHNESYDMASNTWTIRSPIPLSRGTYNSSVVAIHDKIFMFGGGNPPGTGHYPYVNLYDVKSDTWSADVAALPYPASGAMAISHGGFIYVFGGRSGAESGLDQPFRKIAIKLDPASHEVTNVVAPEYFRESGKAFSLSDRIFLIGGSMSATAAASAPRYPKPLVEVYDPSPDTWEKRGEVPINGLPVLSGETIYLVARDLSLAYQYEIERDSWRLVESSFDNELGLTHVGDLVATDDTLYAVGAGGPGDRKLGVVIRGVPERISAPEGGVEIVHTDGTRTLIQDAGFYLGPLSGTAKGVPVAQGSVRKLIPWQEVNFVEFVNGGTVRVSRVDGRTVEGTLRIHTLRKELLGRDIDCDTVSIPVHSIRWISVQAEKQSTQ